MHTKSIITAAIACLSLVVGSPRLSAQNSDELVFAVQVGAFEKRVQPDYFAGLERVFEAASRYDIIYYYIPAKDKVDAERIMNDAKSKGFSSAQVINFEEIRERCSAECGYAPRVPKNMNVKEIQWIFFDFDRSDLRSASREELEKVYFILRQNPTWSVEFKAHTDSRGSDDYNKALSERRARSAKSFVAGLGISTSRIKTSVYGESHPIARNEVNGQDTEIGRQFNRRVEIIISNDKNEVVNIVKAADIPLDLQISGD